MGRGEVGLWVVFTAVASSVCGEGNGSILSYGTTGPSPGICCARISYARNVQIRLSKEERICHGNH